MKININIGGLLVANMDRAQNPQQLTCYGYRYLPLLRGSGYTTADWCILYRSPPEGPSRSRSKMHSSQYSFPLPCYTQDHLPTHQHRDENSSSTTNSATVPLLAAASAAGRESQAASNLPRESPQACETEGSDSRARVDRRDEGDEVDTLRRALKAAEDRALEAETLRAEEERSRLREEARASALEERVAELEKLLAQHN